MKNVPDYVLIERYIIILSFHPPWKKRLNNFFADWHGFRSVKILTLLFAEKQKRLTSANSRRIEAVSRFSRTLRLKGKTDEIGQNGKVIQSRYSYKRKRQNWFCTQNVFPGFPHLPKTRLEFLEFRHLRTFS